MIKIELTEQQRDVLWNILKTLCIVPNPVYESLRDQLHPKKESVEFEINEWYGGIIKHGTVFVWAKTKEHESFGITYGRPDFEKLIKLYTLKKHEVADE